MRQTLPSLIVGLLLAALVLVPSAEAHDLGCVLSAHAQGAHAHVVCDETQTPVCFLNTSAPSAKVETLCGDATTAECLLVLHAPGVNLRHCAL